MKKDLCAASRGHTGSEGGDGQNNPRATSNITRELPSNGNQSPFQFDRKPPSFKGT